MASMAGGEQLAIKVFLSHKYEAPNVNRFFFQLFEGASVQFEVDKGKFATNVTRLEQMIRDADGFLAIHPADDDGNQDYSETELRDKSKYFRLELELAARSRRPGIVLTDKRFRGIIEPPATMSREQFDVRELVSEGAKPSSGRFARAFAEFCVRVRISSLWDLSAGFPWRDNASVGVLLPSSAKSGYGREEVDAICELIAQKHYKPVVMRWPPALSSGWISELRSFNWVLVDVGAESMGSGVVGFLHGAFIPSMRLLRVDSPEESMPGGAPEPLLYNCVEVGYKKDIARWWDTASLITAVEARLATLDAPTRRLGTREDALAYFQEAAKRKERVFISYSGADEEATKILRAEFARRFQDVFDYRDGKSIRPGQPWIEEISSSLAKSPICVLLLSSTYVESGNCQHELDDAVALRNDRKTRIFPIRLSPGVRIPDVLRSLQYMSLDKYPSPAKLVDDLIAQLSSPASAGAEPLQS
jgi:hypothetical protein